MGRYALWDYSKEHVRWRFLESNPFLRGIALGIFFFPLEERLKNIITVPFRIGAQNVSTEIISLIRPKCKYKVNIFIYIFHTVTIFSQKRV